MTTPVVFLAKEGLKSAWMDLWREVRWLSDTIRVRPVLEPLRLQYRGPGRTAILVIPTDQIFD